jgi:ketosteroid isomerase-like protein
MQTYESESPKLAAPIAGYFANQTNDPEALASSFGEDAIVVDEQREHRGRAAIAAWSAAANAKFAFTTEVLEAESEGDRTTVRAKVAGSFPGSPIVLRLKFTLAQGLIARLEITQ